MELKDAIVESELLELLAVEVEALELLEAAVLTDPGTDEPTAMSQWPLK